MKLKINLNTVKKLPFTTRIRSQHSHIDSQCKQGGLPGRNRQKRCLGNGIHSIPCCTTDSHQDDLKQGINRRTDAWQYGGLRKMDDHLVHTTPNHHPPKMDVLPKTFLQIILAANWLVQHSILSPKQQRRPLPSLHLFLLLCTRDNQTKPTCSIGWLC